VGKQATAWVVFALFVLGILYFWSGTAPSSQSSNPWDESGSVRTLIFALGLAGAFLGAWLASIRNENFAKQVDTQTKQTRSEILGRSIQQIGHEKSSTIRTAGIRGLEILAQDNKDDVQFSRHICGILQGFLDERTPMDDEAPAFRNSESLLRKLQRIKSPCLTEVEKILKPDFSEQAITAIMREINWSSISEKTKGKIQRAKQEGRLRNESQRITPLVLKEKDRQNISTEEADLLFKKIAALEEMETEKSKMEKAIANAKLSRENLTELSDWDEKWQKHKTEVEQTIHTFAHIITINFFHLDLRYSYLPGLYIPKRKDVESSLRAAIFYYSFLPSANFKGQNLEKADLRFTNLEGAVLKNTDLRGAHLNNAYLRYARLEGADLRGANLQGADLRKAEFFDTDLRGTHLFTTDLGGANLKKARMQNTVFATKKLKGADFTDANLKGAFYTDDYIAFMASNARRHFHPVTKEWLKAQEVENWNKAKGIPDR